MVLKIGDKYLITPKRPTSHKGKIIETRGRFMRVELESPALTLGGFFKKVVDIDVERFNFKPIDCDEILGLNKKG